MKRATVISIIGHGAILAWALLSFARPLDKLEGETFPADVLTADEFSKIAAGDPNKEFSEKPKPVIDKIDTPTPPPEDPTASVDKKVVTAAAEQTNPEPSPPVPEPKPAAAPPEAKAETKTPEKEPDQKIDPIAETLKKEEAKKPEKKAEVKPQPEKKPEPQRAKFDPRQAQALIDKRKPTRLASAGSELNNIVSRGAPKGTAPELSADEGAAIQRHVENNWTKPNNWEQQRLVIDVDIEFNIDGTFAKPPVVITPGSGPLYEAVKASAMQALRKALPFYFLKPARYEHWKNVTIAFDTKNVNR